MGNRSQAEPDECDWLLAWLEYRLMAVAAIAQRCEVAWQVQAVKAAIDDMRPYEPAACVVPTNDWHAPAAANAVRRVVRQRPELSYALQGGHTTWRPIGKNRRGHRATTQLTRRTADKAIGRRRSVRSRPASVMRPGPLGPPGPVGGGVGGGGGGAGLGGCVFTPAPPLRCGP